MTAPQVDKLLATGTLLATMGRQQEALDYFDQALQMDPTYSEVWFNKGQKARLLREWLAQVDMLPEEMPTELAARDLIPFLPEEGTALVAFNVTNWGSVVFILHRPGLESGEPPQVAGEWSPLPTLTGPVGDPSLEVITVPGFTKDDSWSGWILLTPGA